MVGPDQDSPEYRSLWKPWTRSDGPFYKSCAVWFTNEQPADPPGLRVCTGTLRWTLRHTPLIILLAALVSFTGEQLGSYFAPLGAFLPIGASLPSVNLLVLPVLILGLVWVAGLVWLFATTGSATLELHKTVLFYLTAGLFLFGVAYSVYLVATKAVVGDRQPLAFRAGYFLFLFLEAHLVYDGLVLRSENLFWHLKDREIVDRTRYASFLERFQAALGDTIMGVPRATIFAVFVLLPITALPILSIGPPSPPEAISFATITFLQFIMIATMFQFGVLLRYFNELLSADYLDYKPFHPDEHGGFRDLGRFATRVNVILVVAGAYVALRVYTNGLLTLPPGGFERTVDLLNWLTSYLGPVLVYVIFVLMWLYYSFWRIHRKMVEGRQRKIEELQRHAWQEQDDVDTATRMENIDLDAPAWESLKSAPVWPIRRTSLVGIVIIDAVPVPLSIAPQ